MKYRYYCINKITKSNYEYKKNELMLIKTEINRIKTTKNTKNMNLI